jgi:MFS family permease
MALSINVVAAIAGQFLGLIVGGLLAPIDWQLTFLVSVPFGLLGTVRAYLRLRDTAFRGYNPIQQLLAGKLANLSPDQVHYLTGRGFFPQLISGPFEEGLAIAFASAAAVCAIGMVASLLAGGKPVNGTPVPAASASTRHTDRFPHTVGKSRNRRILP